MSGATVTGAPVVPVEKKSGFTFFQVLILSVVLFFGTGYVIDKMHPRTPIKNAVAGVISMAKYALVFIGILPAFAEPGQPISEGSCECQCNDDGTATAEVDGHQVSAMNHEFGS